MEDIRRNINLLNLIVHLLIEIDSTKTLQKIPSKNQPYRNYR